MHKQQQVLVGALVNMRMYLQLVEQSLASPLAHPRKRLDI
jgi:uncharacterized membrane protein